MGDSGLVSGVSEDDDDFVKTRVEIADKHFLIRNIVDEVSVNVHLECFVVLCLHQN